MSQMRKKEIHPRASGSILNFIENQTELLAVTKIILKFNLMDA